MQKHRDHEFKKPISNYSIDLFNKICEWVTDKGKNKIILDIGCGVGESSYHLGLEYRDALIIGIDKSLDRIERKNHFKKYLPENVLLVRGDMIDLWKLFLEQKNKLKIIKQYILYPNPYPKKKHLKLRWQGHAIFPTIMAIDSPIEVRSNWKLYLEEFYVASKIFSYQSTDGIQTFLPEVMQTPFERKYAESGQNLYQIHLKPSIPRELKLE